MYDIVPRRYNLCQYYYQLQILNFCCMFISAHCHSSKICCRENFTIICIHSPCLMPRCTRYPSMSHQSRLRWLLIHILIKTTPMSNYHLNCMDTKRRNRTLIIKLWYICLNIAIYIIIREHSLNVEGRGYKEKNGGGGRKMLNS